MKIQPFIVGSGMSGQAIAKSFAIIDIIDPTLEILTPINVQRNQPLNGLADGIENPVLCLGNPHGLHAEYLIKGQQAGFRDIILDKPACVTTEEIDQLRGLEANVAVLHGFRMMWGPQTLKKMLEGGEFGEVISMEGKYWQSSAGEIALSDGNYKDKTWKSDIKLNGNHDTLVDLGTHWTDLMLFLAGEKPKNSRRWLSYINAPTPHRDTHAHLYFEFNHSRALGSISKTAHGSGNHLEINILGQKQSATWLLQRPDEIIVGAGNKQTSIRKMRDHFGSQQPPFHGIGWLEGYTEVIHSFLEKKAGQDAPAFPTLDECLDVMEVVLKGKDL